MKWGYDKTTFSHALVANLLNNTGNSKITTHQLKTDCLEQKKKQLQIRINLNVINKRDFVCVSEVQPFPNTSHSQMSTVAHESTPPWCCKCKQPTERLQGEEVEKKNQSVSSFNNHFIRSRSHLRTPITGESEKVACLLLSKLSF